MTKTLSKVGLWLLFPFAILADVISILFTVASICTGDVDLVWFGVTGKLFRKMTGRKDAPIILKRAVETARRVRVGQFQPPIALPAT